MDYSNKRILLIPFPSQALSQACPFCCVGILSKIHTQLKNVPLHQIADASSCSYSCIITSKCCS